MHEDVHFGYLKRMYTNLYYRSFFFFFLYIYIMLLMCYILLLLSSLCFYYYVVTWMILQVLQDTHQRTSINIVCRYN
jgi:hypothetical protein